MCQDDRAGAGRPAAVRVQLEAAVDRRDVVHPLGAEREPVVAQPVEGLVEVDGVVAAREEGLGVGLPPGPPGPLDEVGGDLREGTHVPRADVEEVAPVGGAVGQPLAELTGRVVDGHREVVRPRRHQVDGGERAAGPAPDDRHVDAGRRRTCPLRHRWDVDGADLGLKHPITVVGQFCLCTTPRVTAPPG